MAVNITQGEDPRYVYGETSELYWIVPPDAIAAKKIGMWAVRTVALALHPGWLGIEIFKITNVKGTLRARWTYSYPIIHANDPLECFLNTRCRPIGHPKFIPGILPYVEAFSFDSAIPANLSEGV